MKSVFQKVTNPITISIVSTEYFGTANYQENKMSEANTCGCGRSPTGKCVGWHNLTEVQYAEKRAQWEAKQAEKKAS